MSVFSMAGSNPALPTYPLQRSVRLRSSASAYFNRTPATTTNQKTFTFSFWFKGLPPSAANFQIFSTPITTAPNTGSYITFSNGSLGIVNYVSSLADAALVTTQVFRDPSSWYHITIAIDTTQATASNRIKIYVNGAQVTVFNTATYSTLNSNYNFNSNVAHIIGAANVNSTISQFLDGYLTEVNFVDGQQLDAASFGAYNSYGVWSPAKYTGTYGTNGFYLNFQDNSALTTTANIGIGKDSSGNGNYWTSNNISLTAGVTYDSMLDVPTLTSNTNANFPVLNVVAGLGNGTYSDGNLAYLNGVAATWKSGVGSMGATSGKYYFEYTVTAVSNSSNFYLGVAGSTYNGFASYLGKTSDSWAFQWNGASSVKTNNDTNTTVSTAGSISVNDVIQIAIDLGTGSIWWGRNNTWVQGSPSAGTGASYTNLTGTILPGFAVYSNGGDKIAANFGQRPFTYTPPTGFKSLNTFNLPDSIVPVGAQYMAATTYTGNGSSLAVTNTVNGTSFQPDFVWVKNRTTALNHILVNSVVGPTLFLNSNTTSAESNTAGVVTALNSNGFSVGSVANVNQNTNALVGWQWRASNASAVTNTAGTISSQVSANPTAGFSIVTYTGTGANATVGHGLGVAPRMVIVKRRSSTSNWSVLHTSIPGSPDNFLYLNSTSAVINAGVVFNGSNPSTTVFSVGTDASVNASGGTFVAYCFAAVPGYSAFGSYTGNGSADGPFVYLGFRPRFVLYKSATEVTGWAILDTSRSPSNVADKYLNADTSAAEATASLIDIISNGFKVRNTFAGNNTNGATYIYAAFAENPFKNALAR